MYENLDRLIIEQIASGCKSFGQINARYVLKEAERLSEATGREAFRVSDGRLQAMKRAGRIKYTKATINGAGGWEVVRHETPNV